MRCVFREPLFAVFFYFQKFLIHASRAHEHHEEVPEEEARTGIGKADLVLDDGGVECLLVLENQECLRVGAVCPPVLFQYLKLALTLPFGDGADNLIRTEGEYRPEGVLDSELGSRAFALGAEKLEIIPARIVAFEVGKVGEYGPDHERREGQGSFDRVNHYFLVCKERLGVS